MRFVPSLPTMIPHLHEPFAGQSAPLRMMSFNIRYATANDGSNRWERRRELVVRTIRRFAPDVLGTQECLPMQRCFLSRHLPEYEHVGVGRDDGRQAGEMCAIFYRADRFERLDEGHFWLSETPDVPGSRSWDSSMPRVTTWVRLRDRQRTSDSFYFLNTHLDVRGPAARREGARVIREQARRFQLPQRIVLAGDFNTGPATAPYTTITRGVAAADEPWSDTYDYFCRHICGGAAAPGGTRHDFTGRTDVERIDWIVASSHFEVIEADIDCWHENGRWPSDHFPVTAVLRLAPD
jgi:endonuclease/exonuclease/phosphatase family metal-dependent hydrolase